MHQQPPVATRPSPYSTISHFVFTHYITILIYLVWRNPTAVNALGFLFFVKATIFFIFAGVFRLVNKDAQWPPLYDHVERKLATVSDKGYDKVGDFVLRDGIDLIPQEGMQENICKCESNLIFACGQATSGKSFSLFLKALQGVGVPNYTGRLINVRKLDSAKGTSMFRDASLCWGQFSNCQVTTGELPTFAWPQWNNAIQMIHANFNADNPSEWEDFIEYIKKQQAAFIAGDEITAIEQFKMFSYIFSRNRDSSGITPQFVATFNPKHDHWTTEMLVCGGYIDTETWYIKPEMDGRERFFYIQGNTPQSIVWGDTREEVVAAAHIKLNKDDIAAGLKEEDMVKSFTLFTGTAAGNRKLVAATKGQSVANLHNVGGDQRAVLAEAYFGEINSEEQNVTKQMMRDIQTNPYDDDEAMYGTMDVSGGELDSDDNPFIAWKGHTIVGIEFFRGDPKELVDWISLQLEKYNIPMSNFAFDATGIGYYLKAFTSGWPMTANKTPMAEYDEQGNQVLFERYFNLRSQLLGKMEVALKTGKISTTLDLNMRIKYGKKGATRQLIDVLYDESNVFRTLQRNGRIYYRSKDEYRARFHASPNIVDAMYIRMIFDLDARPKKKPAHEIPDDAYDGLYNRYGGGRSAVWI